MKIVFINPPAEHNIIRRWRCAIEQGNYLFPPMELSYLAGMAKSKKNIEYKLMDCVADNLDRAQVIKQLEDYKPDFLVFMPGFESINRDIRSMVDLNSTVKARLITFGHYPTKFSDQLLKTYPLEFIFRGDPEFTFSELMDALHNKTDLSVIKGLSYKKADGSVHVNPAREDIKNLDLLPFPDFSQLDLNKYFSGFRDKAPFTTMITSRGCSFRCTYCVRSYGDTWRQRSTDNVIAEIEQLVKDHNIKALRILDDTFTLNRNWVLEFCKKMVDKKFNLEWSCLSRPETITEDMMEAMSKAGCNRIMIGIESGSDKILQAYKRFYKIDDKIKKVFADLRKHGIESFTWFIIGAPYETEEDVRKSIEAAKFLNPDWVALNMMRAYPGTEDFDKLMAKGEVDFQLTPYRSEFKTQIMSEQKVKDMLFEFYRAFYFRPSWLIRKLPVFIAHPVFAYSLASEYIKWELQRTNMTNKKNELAVAD